MGMVLRSDTGGVLGVSALFLFPGLKAFLRDSMSWSSQEVSSSRLGAGGIGTVVVSSTWLADAHEGTLKQGQLFEENSL